MFLAIDENESRPVYQQIAQGIKERICRGELKPGEPLPSVRELAQALSINLHTARHAYQTLAQEGIVSLRLGRLARVAPLAREGNAEKAAKIAGRLKELVSDALLSGLSPEDFKGLVDAALLSGRPLSGKEERA
jgi:DNA-binding transcriptional regulator YhcF (GntR family)